MKRRTYRNCLIICNRIRRKGYDRETAQELMLRIFDEYEANPQGLSIEAREAMIEEAHNG